MNAPRVASDKARPVFTDGSLIRHVAVMTATGAVGLTAVFSIDLLSLFWVSRLGDQAYKAAIGYVGLATFFAMSISIGLTIAASATVSRALGADDRPRGRRLAASALTITALISTAVAALMFAFRDWGLTTLLHASGEPLRSRFEVSRHHPAGECADGARHGDVGFVARRRRRAPRHVCDAHPARSSPPFSIRSLIFGFGLGVYGAAWASVVVPPHLALCRLAWRRQGARHRRAPEPRRDARRLRADHGGRLSGDHGQSRDACRLCLYGQGLLRHRRGGDRRRGDHRPGDACRLRHRLRADRLDRPDHRPELRRKADGAGPAGADQFVSSGDRLCARRLGGVGLRRAMARLGLRRQGRQRRLCHLLLPLWRRRLALSRMPLRRQHRVQQSRLSGSEHGLQLGPGDARHDSVRDLGRALWWSAGRPHRRGARLRGVRPHRCGGGLCGDGPSGERDRGERLPHPRALGPVELGKAEP